MRICLSCENDILGKKSPSTGAAAVSGGRAVSLAFSHGARVTEPSHLQKGAWGPGQHSCACRSTRKGALRALSNSLFWNNQRSVLRRQFNT